MSKGGRPVERFNCKCKTDRKRGSMKKKHTKVLTFARPGLNQFFMVTVVSGFHLQHLNSLYEVYSLHIRSHDECLANDWISASAFNLFPYLHYVLS